MLKKSFPKDSSGLVEGVDRPVWRTRANVIAGYLEPAENEATRRGGRGQAFLDEEGAWLNSAHFEE